MDKENVVCIYTHIHTHTKCSITQPLLKNEIMPFATKWMDIEIILLDEVRQTKIMISLICGIKTNDTNELTYKTEA